MATVKRYIAAALVSLGAWCIGPLQSQAQVGKATLPDTAILALFQKVDAYMEMEYYDSADLVLEQIGQTVNFKDPDYTTYYYHSRQAEVMYYSNLLQLGLQKARRALLTAQALGDSVLIADSYNFLGLFSGNLERYDDAIRYYSTALKYCPPNTDYHQYLSLSMPHHLYANLGEAFTRQKKYKEALPFFEKSLDMATQAGAGRAMAVACLSAAEALAALQQMDTVLLLLREGLEYAIAYKDFDIALLAHAYYAKTFTMLLHKEEAYQSIENGVALQKRVQKINPFYTLLFLREATAVFKKWKDFEKLTEVQEMIMQLEMMVRANNNVQIEQVLATGLTNENKLLQLEIKDALQRQSQANTRMVILILLILILLLGGAYYRYTVRQRLRLAELSNKLSQNLHDDIGASLSSLHIYGDLAVQTFYKKPEKSLSMMEKVVQQSKALMDNMNDMVWSMKPQSTNGMSLATRIKNYGVELLQAKGIDGYYTIDETVLDDLLDFEEKRSLLLVVKEGINNIAKYSMATTAHIEIKLTARNITLQISDNGTGCEWPPAKPGNGVQNMEARVKALGGTTAIKTAPNQGFIFWAAIPQK